jgi:hypothetical protein
MAPKGEEGTNDFRLLVIMMDVIDGAKGYSENSSKSDGCNRESHPKDEGQTRTELLGTVILVFDQSLLQ